MNYFIACYRQACFLICIRTALLSLLKETVKNEKKNHVSVFSSLRDDPIDLKYIIGYSKE